MRDRYSLRSASKKTALALAAALGISGALWAVEPKEPGSYLDLKEFWKPELYISSSHEALEDVLPALANRQAWEAFMSGRENDGQVQARAFIDPRSGAATNLMAPFPLIPGRGVGNRVTLEELGQRLGRSLQAVDRNAVAEAVLGFVRDHRAVLAIDVGQLGPGRATQVNPDLWQVSIPQSYHGIPVRHGRLAASINNGNLVVIGTETWGDVRRLSPEPKIAAEDALAIGFKYAGGESAFDEMVREPALEVIPVAPQDQQRGGTFGGSIGTGYGHRLAWTFAFRRPPDDATWEVIVDAHDGELLAFQDINHYVTQSITGGVYPLTSTEICPNAQQCGTMQSGWPMPWANTGLASPNNFANSAGLFDHTSGTATTTLSGRYFRMSDSCGAISQGAAGSIAMGGTNGQHDCTVPSGTSAGNTAASRSGYYELNKLGEQARGWLPSNSWLQTQLTANMNLSSTCNAFWNGSTINFYRSGGGCRNTGELAAVFDHEWGHGLDDNDANGSLSNSSEAYADIAAIYRLQASCVGHGFFWTSDRGCGQTADGTGFNQNEALTGAAHCDTDCSGVRDADYLKHNPNTPDTALGFVCSSCTTGTGPCGRQVHCAAAPVRQAAWDLVARDLQTSPFNYDSQTAFIIGNKLFYQGSGNVGSWHACTCGSSSSGCGSTNGYMQWITADDDNGNLNDGTPHMTAIYNAFNRHGIACSTPTPANGGCASGPSAAATLSASAGNNSASLSWGSVSGATRYWVFRSEGHAGCNFGKALIGETTGTSYTDTQVANGRAYAYNVVAAGTSSACYGRASNCATVTPASAPDFSVSCSPASLTVTQGGSTTSTCTVTSSGGFSSSVSLACASLPSGSSCGFSPNPVTPPANGSVNSTLTLAANATAATGSFTFQVQGTSGSTTKSFNVGLTVNPAGSGGAQTAVFDTALQAPKCGTVGSSCDSSTLVNSRDNLATAEPNQPNTINDSCADGTSGTYHSDESNDRLVVSTTDGTNFAPGKTVRIDATVWAWSTPSSDRLDLYYAPDATSPTWTRITTLTPSVAGAQTLSATYTLPTGGALQAVRAQFRYQSTDAACSAGGYNDRDDLVFAVETGPADTTPPTTAITSPLNGATVSGTVSVTASASDNVGVTKVELHVDGVLHSTDTTSPYSFSWNTTTVANGSHSLVSKAYDAAGNVGTSSTVTVTVSNTAAADLTATYDATLRAPKCATVGKSCTSGTLVNGRDGKGPEPNQPNTINNSCADGTSGTYHVDESLDVLKVSTTDGTAFAAGKTVRIDATVWAYSSYTSDKLDLYYAPNANSPTWTLIGTFTPPGSGARTMSATYTLPSGSLQAIRAQFRYGGSASTCTSGGYNDRDDLIFAVQ